MIGVVEESDARVIGSPILTDGIMCVEVATDKSSSAREFRFMSWSTSVTLSASPEFHSPPTPSTSKVISPQ